MSASVRYQDLRPGDLFRFDYPHHSEAVVRLIYRKLEVGYERMDGSEKRRDPSRSNPIPIELVIPMTDQRSSNGTVDRELGEPGQL